MAAETLSALATRNRSGSTPSPNAECATSTDCPKNSSTPSSPQEGLRAQQLVHTRSGAAGARASIDGRLAGVLTYVVDGQQCEILTLHASDQWRGVGSALVEAASDVAVAQRCLRLTVTTTNDNVDALRFYQRRDFVLARLRPGAVVDSRASLKPEIPEVGKYGIPLRNEIDLDLDLSMP